MQRRKPGAGRQASPSRLRAANKRSRAIRHGTAWSASGNQSAVRWHVPAGPDPRCGRPARFGFAGFGCAPPSSIDWLGGSARHSAGPLDPAARSSSRDQSTRPGEATLRPVRPARLGPAWPALVRPGLVRLGSARLARLGLLGSARLGLLGSACSARLGSARLARLGLLGSARLGSACSARPARLGLPGSLSARPRCPTAAYARRARPADRVARPCGRAILKRSRRLVCSPGWAATLDQNLARLKVARPRGTFSPVVATWSEPTVKCNSRSDRARARSFLGSVRLGRFARAG
jgi:hypothetical protein